MFTKLATFRKLGLQPAGRQHRIVASPPFHSNDNQPGFRRSERQGLRAQQALACRWSRSLDEGRLECRWEPRSDEGFSTDDRGQPPRSSARE